MSKTAKLNSIYRNDWRDAKSKCDPKALKHCDFNKGLGPALEKLEKTLLPFQDEKTIPEKPTQAITKSVKDIQKIIQKYQEDIASGNKKYPELGENWFRLQSTLKRLDLCIIDVLKSFDIQMNKLNIWIDKKEFQLVENEEVIRIPIPTGEGIYHSNWKSIVQQCSPTAIEKINFTENLGFALDQFEAIHDNIEEKLHQPLREQALEVQRIIKIYFEEIKRCNQEFPEEHLSWFNLHQALMKADKGVCNDTEDYAAVERLDMWLHKREFKPKAPAQKEEDVDYSQEVEKILLYLKKYAENPEALINALTHNDISACMIYTPKAAGHVTGMGKRLSRNYQAIIQHVNKDEIDNAKTRLADFFKDLHQLCSVFDKQASLLEDFLMSSTYTPLEELISEAEKN